MSQHKIRALRIILGTQQALCVSYCNYCQMQQYSWQQFHHYKKCQGVLKCSEFNVLLQTLALTAYSALVSAFKSALSSRHCQPVSCHPESLKNSLPLKIPSKLHFVIDYELGIKIAQSYLDCVQNSIKQMGLCASHKCFCLPD